MIEYVKGEVTELTPAYAVIEAHGVGYGLNISLNTYSAIQGKKEVLLWVYEAIREDAYVLFGFATKQEREMFLLLITVSGVLKGVKGIGLRTAQRIIVDLKDKIVSSGVAQELPANAGKATALVNSPVRDEAVSALTMLGFSPAPTAKVVNAILQKDPTLPVEQVVKLALKQIK